MPYPKENPFFVAASILEEPIKLVNQREVPHFTVGDFSVFHGSPESLSFLMRDKTEPEQRFTIITFGRALRGQTRLIMLTVMDFNLWHDITVAGQYQTWGWDEYPRYSFRWDRSGKLTEFQVKPSVHSGFRYLREEEKNFAPWQRRKLFSYSSGKDLLALRPYNREPVARLPDSLIGQNGILGVDIPWQLETYHSEAEELFHKSHIREFAKAIKQPS